MRILITGKNSFIGKSFSEWVSKNKKNIEIDFISIRNDDYKDLDFNKYSAIIHLAGLVHKNEKKIPYKDFLYVNFEKTKELVNKAIKEKVPHFVFMSSMAIFGKAGRIDEKTELRPSTKYGMSKLYAENYLRTNINHIRLSIVRPPMIYGDDAPGNPKKIKSLLKKVCIFPNLENKRSFLNIENLCQIIFDILINQSIGIFHPSESISSTYHFFKRIKNPQKLYPISLFNPILRSFVKINLLNKLFGDLYYDFHINPIQF